MGSDGYVIVMVHFRNICLYSPKSESKHGHENSVNEIDLYRKKYKKEYSF